MAGPRVGLTEVVSKYRFTEFEIDLSQQELRRLGEAVHIEPQVFDVIVHLVRNHDRIVSKDELIETIWNGRIISEAALSSRINGARRVTAEVIAGARHETLNEIELYRAPAVASLAAWLGRILAEHPKIDP